MMLKYLTSPPDVLRVVRKGPAIKNEVDDAIDLCAGVINLRDSIEESRARCEQATDERQKKAFANRGTRGDRRWLGCRIMTRIALSFAEPQAVLRAHCLPSISTLHRSRHHAIVRVVREFRQEATRCERRPTRN